MQNVKDGFLYTIIYIEVKVNGAYKNIDLKDLGNGDSIVVEKKFDTLARSERPSKFKEGETYTMVRGVGVYNGEEVGFFINQARKDANTWVTADEVADQYDATGGEGTKVKITCTKEMGKDNKGKDVVFTSFAFEKVE